MNQIHCCLLIVFCAQLRGAENDQTLAEPVFGTVTADAVIRLVPSKFGPGSVKLENIPLVDIKPVTTTMSPIGGMPGPTTLACGTPWRLGFGFLWTISPFELHQPSFRIYRFDLEKAIAGEKQSDATGETGAPPIVPRSAQRLGDGDEEFEVFSHDEGINGALISHGKLLSDRFWYLSGKRVGLEPFRAFYDILPDSESSLTLLLLHKETMEVWQYQFWSVEQPAKELRYIGRWRRTGTIDMGFRLDEPFFTMRSEEFYYFVSRSAVIRRASTAPGEQKAGGIGNNPSPVRLVMADEEGQLYAFTGQQFFRIDEPLEIRKIKLTELLEKYSGWDADVLRLCGRAVQAMKQGARPAE